MIGIGTRVEAVAPYWDVIGPIVAGYLDGEKVTQPGAEIDLDGTVSIWDEDTGETIRVNGWLVSFHVA
jgi:hypothetical protein